MVKNLKVKVLFLIFILLLFPAQTLAMPHCSCRKDRPLKLTDPPMTGDDIQSIQQLLKNLGFYKKEVNGVYDKNTYDAIIQFQKSTDLVVDGVLGKATLKALAKFYEEPAASLAVDAPKGNVEIVINALDRTLTIFDDKKPFKTYPVAVGTFKTPTPIGLFTITEKAMWGEGFGSRWMRLSVPWGSYGVHGTNKPWSVGGFESHGCIRMHNQHVEQIYEWVKIGTKVYILGGVDGPFTFGLNTLVEGSKGSDVVEVQKRLAGFGFYDGVYDGIYGASTKEAVISFQQAKGLEVSGNVDKATYESLGILLFE